ncbi:hypothetical protein J1N35_017524 [Gossypium stocksii]|uniref:Homeobox-leucine zipper protein n=1 Tax=Gossypium stocksii TaxID=47602 RepID=A0A9D3VN70_9ROSI|nr:hypothetical protein J1N35_017524 [Gossypium stocksii]
MDWNGTFASRPQPTLNSHYNYNYDQCPDQQGQKQLQRSREDHNCLLERSFREELSRELGLQPRQTVIWFQYRRVEWKAKQLERLYDTLKHDYDVISREKQKLQDEATREQVFSTVDTKISGEETVESTSVPSPNKTTVAASPHVPIPE